MARRSRKNDNSGCLGWIVLLGLAAALIEFLIPFVVVALIIWGIVALISAIVKNIKVQNERKESELRESVQTKISEYSLSDYVTNTAGNKFEPKRLPGWNQEFLIEYWIFFAYGKPPAVLEVPKNFSYDQNKLSERIDEQLLNSIEQRSYP